MVVIIWMVIYKRRPSRRSLDSVWFRRLSD
jgi:hypothetical protein